MYLQCFLIFWLCYAMCLESTSEHLGNMIHSRSFYFYRESYYDVAVKNRKFVNL